VGIKPREVNAETRGSDLNFLKLRWSCGFQGFGTVSRKTKLSPRVERDHDTPGSTVKAGGNSDGSSLQYFFRSPVRPFEFFTTDHVSSPSHCTAPPHSFVCLV